MALAAGVATLVIPTRRAQLAAAAAASVAAMAVGGAAYWVGHSGDELVYKNGAAAAYSSGAVGTAREQGREEEDDWARPTLRSCVGSRCSESGPGHPSPAPSTAARAQARIRASRGGSSAAASSKRAQRHSWCSGRPSVSETGKTTSPVALSAT
jgi:hypothetical protein